jgi:hypothetical protein
VKVEITKERDARKPKGSAFFNALSRSKDTFFSLSYFVSAIVLSFSLVTICEFSSRKFKSFSPVISKQIQ